MSGADRARPHRPERGFGLPGTASSTCAWCFDHGRLHCFPWDGRPWCTAAWVPFAAATAEQAVEAEQAAYCDARFLGNLCAEAQLDVLKTRGSWS